MSIRTRGPSSG